MRQSMYFSTVLLVVLLGFNSLWAGEKIRLTTGEWPPYISTDLAHDGVLSRIVTEAFKREGIEITYDFMPWKRAMVLARNGKADGSFAWSRSEEREKDLYYSKPFAYDQSVFFHKKDLAFDWKGFEDLGTLKIGATLAYNYGREFEDAENRGRIKVERVGTDETNLKKLLGNRIDLFICNLEVGYSMLNKMYDQKTVDLLTTHPKAVNKNGLCLVLTKKNAGNANLVKLFDKGLEELKADGTLDHFLKESREGKYIK